jgi:hypothetical protein
VVLGLLPPKEMGLKKERWYSLFQPVTIKAYSKLLLASIVLDAFRGVSTGKTQL